jgi:hypothetical protein
MEKKMMTCTLSASSAELRLLREKNLMALKTNKKIVVVVIIIIEGV